MIPDRFKISLILSLFFLACGQQQEVPSNDQSVITDADTVEIKFARGFHMVEKNGLKYIEQFSPWKRSEDTLRYCLVSDSTLHPELSKNEVLIRTPVRSVVCLSTTHIGYIDLLGKNKSVTGIAGTKWVNNPEIREMVANGSIKDVGIDNHLNYELILDLDPDVVFAYGIEGHSMNYKQKLESFGIPVVMVSEYMETDPLGKAEWLRFIAAFYEEDSLAAREFNDISDRYRQVKTKVMLSSSLPSVFVGLPWKGDWFVPGGKSFQAQLLRDAGANYLWGNNDERSGMIVDIEVVFEKALQADYWLNLNDYHTLEEVRGLDERYMDFKAMKQGNVYNNNLRQNLQLGNDYWESGVVKPDVILKDLVSIFHPGYVKDHELYYYRKLE